MEIDKIQFTESEHSTLFALVVANLQSLSERKIDSTVKAVIVDLLSI